MKYANHSFTTINMKISCKFIVLIVAVMSTSCSPDHGKETLKINEKNSHYFSFRGKPAILMGSTEHYGALMNLDFDYEKYLDELQRCNLNLTRTFSGIYVEPEGAFNIEKNTLAPAYGRYINPFARSNEPGYANGGNKFDLTKWDPDYFERLRDFMTEADKRDIIVEITLFSSIYEEAQWKLNPFHPDNNINNLPEIDFKDVHSLENYKHIEIQNRMVQKIVEELNGFDNLYFEVCNEPYADMIDDAWHHHIAGLIIETEKNLPKKHLVSYNYKNNLGYLSVLPAAYSILNFHYAVPDAVIQNRHLQIPIGDNETGFKGTADWPYRTEAWAFMIAGGALFNHLDYSFAVEHESGNFQYPQTQPGGGNAGLRMQLGFLRQFLEQLDFLHMKTDTTLVRNISNNALESQAANINDQQYLVYLYEKHAGVHENVSLRFTGDFHVPESGRYTFKTISDDGVRLWVNEVLVIDNWTDHAAVADTGIISLEKGSIIPVKLEYYNNLYGGSIRATWHTDASIETILGSVATHYPGTYTKGLKVEYYKGMRLNVPVKTDTIHHINHAIQEFDFTASDTTWKADSVMVSLDAGYYSISWIDPKNGKSLHAEDLQHSGGSVTLKSVAFDHDILLMIQKK